MPIRCSAATGPFQLRRALRQRHSGRPGPVWIVADGSIWAEPAAAAIGFPGRPLEVSGLAVEVLQRLPLDLDIHEIPARREDPAHHHYDVRFAFRVVGSEECVVHHLGVQP